MNKYLVALAVSILFAGGIYKFSREASAPPISPAPSDASENSLNMKPWTWVETLYNDERVVKPKKPDSFTITFGNDSRFSATTDCNSVAGNYKTVNEALTFSDISSTKKYCEGSQEGEFMTMLRDISAYHFSPDGGLILDIKFDSGSVVFK